jgi:serine/threonine protein kinase/outer membrane murein-binding lipoprotein Lpp
MLGQTIGVRYKILKHLGGGGFGQTYLAEDAYIPDNALCVVKHLKPQSSDPFTLQTSRRLFDSEARILNKLGNHPQIPRLLAHFEENQEFYLVQEFVEGHDLSLEIVIGRQYGEPEVIKLLWDILEILTFVHQNHAIHRDLKPSNIMRRAQDDKLVLIDFGAVKQISTQIMNLHGQTQRSVAIGTRGFAAPELLGGKPHWASDIYAIGMIGIQALTGVFPLDLAFDLQTGEVTWRNQAVVSQALGDILDGMTRYDYRHRYQNTIAVMQALQPLVAQQIPISNPQAFAPPGLPSQPPQVASTNPQLSPPPTVPHQGSPPTSQVPSSTSQAIAPHQVSSTTQPAPPPPTVLNPPAVPPPAAASAPQSIQAISSPTLQPTTFHGSASSPPSGSPPSGSPPSGSPPSGSSSGSPSSPPTMTFGRMSPTASNPATLLNPTVPDPTLPKTSQLKTGKQPSKRLWLGAGAAAVVLALGVGSWQYISYAQQRSAIAALKTLKAKGQFAECIRQAQALPRQAEALLILGECQLRQAKQLAQKQDFKGAIAMAQQVAAEHPAHVAAQQLIGESFKGLLAQATQFARTGKLKDAITTASIVPKNHSTYAEAQKLIGDWSKRILTLAQQRYEAGKKDEAIALAKVIPSSSPKAKEVQSTIQRWESDWKSDQATFNKAKKAYESSNWQTLLSEIDKLKNPYWQKRADAWVAKAQTEIARAAPRPVAPAAGGYVQPASASEPAYAPEPSYASQPAYSAPEPAYNPPEPAYEPPPEPAYNPPAPDAPIQVPQSDSSACGGGAC